MDFKNLILLFFSCLPMIVTAQGNGLASEAGNIFDYYNKTVGQGAAIFKGPKYPGGDATVKGHQFYPARNYNYGSVIYRDYQYDSVILNYDAVTDQLVLVFSEQGEFEAITPDIELISSFMIPESTSANQTAIGR